MVTEQEISEFAHHVLKLAADMVQRLGNRAMVGRPRGPYKKRRKMAAKRKKKAA